MATPYTSPRLPGDVGQPFARLLHRENTFELVPLLLVIKTCKPRTALLSGASVEARLQAAPANSGESAT